MPSRHDYRDQAARYDRTRGASPSITGPLVAALEGSPGPFLLDVAGGTGNYAAALRDHGYRPTVVDITAEMLERARTKGLPVVRADATCLPIEDASVDAVMIVSALHLVTDWRSALAEARRVIRPGGRLAITDYTRENLGVHWILDYFPSARNSIVPNHIPLADLLADLPGARARPFEFTDLVDASMSALCRRPELLLDPGFRMQTSFFESLARNDPAEAGAGIERLERDLGAGRRPDEEVSDLRARVGDGTIIAWPAP